MIISRVEVDYFSFVVFLSPSSWLYREYLTGFSLEILQTKTLVVSLQKCGFHSNYLRTHPTFIRKKYLTLLYNNKCIQKLWQSLSRTLLWKKFMVANNSSCTIIEINAYPAGNNTTVILTNCEKDTLLLTLALTTKQIGSNFFNKNYKKYPVKENWCFEILLITKA